MKTFEDALQLVMRVDPVTSTEGRAQIEDSMMATADRYVAIASEANENESFCSIMEAWMEEISEGHDPSDMLMTAFMNGLIVGMEMEKP